MKITKIFRLVLVSIIISRFTMAIERVKLLISKNTMITTIAIAIRGEPLKNWNYSAISII